MISVSRSSSVVFTCAVDREENEVQLLTIYMSYLRSYPTFEGYRAVTCDIAELSEDRHTLREG